MCPEPTSGSSDWAQNSRIMRLKRGDFAWGEHPRQQLAVHVMDRRIFEDEHARRDVEIGLDQLQDDAPGGTERAVVDQTPC